MKERGFVLALTLWVIAIIAVIATYFSNQVEKSTELATQASENTRELVDLASTRAEILFRLATTPFSIYGLGKTREGSIALDDRPYQGEGKVLVRLQDDRGLLNLNIVDDGKLGRFLSTLGIPGDQVNVMIDTLRDYTDTDSFKRLNGAEKDDYLALNLPPPRNEQLTTPYETKNIIGWKDKPALWKDSLLPSLTTTSFSVAMNPNTAPWQVLTSLPGINYPLAKIIMDRRKIAPFTDPAEIAALIKVPTSALAFMVIALPANTIRVTEYTPTLPRGWQFNVSLTPDDMNAPWRIDYDYKVALGYRDDEVISPLPARSALPATSSLF